MHVGAPGQPAETHLGGDQPGCRFRRREQREPARMLVGRDPALLIGVHRDQGVQRRARGREGRVGGLEQHRLAGRGGPHDRAPAPPPPPRRSAGPDPAAPPSASPDPAAPPKRAQAAASVAGSACRPSLASSRVSISATS